jgi:ribose 5-phosphate isomerase B
MAREHNDANILALPSDYIDFGTAEQIVAAWLATEFSGEERHARRLAKIEMLTEHSK